MKILSKITLILTASILLFSCESTELDLVEDPNNLTPEQSDPDLLLNSIQISFQSIMSGFNAPSRDIIRMENQFATYGAVVDENTLNTAGGEWATAYRMFNNVSVLSDLADAQELPFHKGIGQVIQAYTYVMLVDYLGEVPFSQANMPEMFPNPEVDGGASIYTAMYDLIDEAIVNLQTETLDTPNDLFYGGDAESWVALANTLKLKMYVQTRLVNSSESASGITDIVNSGTFIDELNEDFEFQYSTAGAPVDSRHPFFTGHYLAGGAQTYMSNYYMFLLKDDKADPDPRLPYYLYRQTDRAPMGDEIPCEGNPVYDFCYIGDFYWGRDHADDEGLPGDNLLRTTYGIYPGGGAFDEGQALSVTNTSLTTAGGAGILPIFLSSFTHFTLAEAALTLGTPGDPRTLLGQGVTLSMQKVSGFAGAPEIDPMEISQYANLVQAEYDLATSDEERLEIILREYYLAAWGNGIEPYNFFRRTGLPDLQSPVLPAGPFPRSFRYPTNAVQANPNISQRQLTDQVFWDNNPATFID